MEEPENILVTSTDNQDYVGVQEAAKLLYLCDRTVRNMIRRGEIKGARKVGKKGKYLIPRSEIYKQSRPVGEHAEASATAQADSAPSAHGENRDRELGPHAGELFSLAQCLRDNLKLLAPLHAAVLDLSNSPLKLWSTGFGITQTWKGWPSVSCDIRSEPLFDSLKQHLRGSQCWAILDSIRDSFLEYQEASARCYAVVRGEVSQRLPKPCDRDMEGMTDSLFVDAYYRARGLPGIDFRYEPQSIDQQGKTFWFLRLGAWGVGSEEYPAALQPLAASHRELTAVLPSRAYWSVLAEADRECIGVIEKFRQSLTPDARLRKLILEGHCDLCP